MLLKINTYKIITKKYSFFLNKAQVNFVAAVNLIRTELEQIFIVMALG